MKNSYIGKKRTTRPKFSPIAFIFAIIVLVLSVMLLHYGLAHETYEVRTITEKNGSIIEKNYKREVTYPVKVSPSATSMVATGGAALAVNMNFEDEIGFPIEPFEAIEPVFEEKIEAMLEDEPVKHFPESTYIKGAITVNGEAGGVSSITERSGVLWIICDRVVSENAFFPDDIESVIEQKWQFDGYDPNGTYTQADYDLAVDVFERFYREMQGETAVEVGRSLPVEYVYFTGDGVHNYFTVTQNGTPYVFGSQLISPYKN